MKTELRSARFMERDLKKSGLDPTDINVIPLPFAEHVAPAYRIQYPGREGMYRDRIKNGDPKYLGPKNLTGVWFRNLGARTAWAEAPVRLIVEGEKKAAAAERYLEKPAAGIGGCWGWSCKGSLLVALRSGLDQCSSIYVVLDSDVHTNPNVNKAAHGLLKALREHGYAGRVRFVELPSADDGKGKVGLDDWIAEQPIGLSSKELWARFRALPEIIIDRQEVPPLDSLIATQFEWQAAQLTPPCIVEKYLYQDVGVLSAPGGTGKTTQALYEAVCIALGRPVYDQFEVQKPGRTLFVTAEDRKGQMIARLRAICESLSLSRDEVKAVRDFVLIWDVVGRDMRLLSSTSRGGPIEVSPVVQRMVEQWKGQGLVLINFDPMISFGIDEERTNTNAQALVTAGRQIMSEVGVCFRFIHHVSQEAGRAKILDQYAARGGSALTDGCRMVAVLQSVDQYADDDEDSKKVKKGLPIPAGLAVTEGESVTVLARPKLSHCEPQFDKLLWVARKGFTFRGFLEQKLSQAERSKLDEDIEACFAKGLSIRDTMKKCGATMHHVRRVKADMDGER